MPLILPSGFPAISTLAAENIPLTLTDGKAATGSVAPIRIAVLNLMPQKIETETDIVRMLSYSALTIDLKWMKLRSHVSTHVPPGHMDTFYEFADTLMTQPLDGLIVTGAPVETMAYEAVDYWTELTAILDWARTHVRSTLYLCWGAMAALYHFYAIPKHLLPTKCFGVFDTMPSSGALPIFRGMDDVFRMPNSRHTEIHAADVEATPGISVIAHSPEAGVSIVASSHGHEFYVLGHLEYPVWTLGNEYRRDLGKRDDVDIPQHYYPNDNPACQPQATWRSAATLFYNNWVQYYVAPTASVSK